MFHSFDYVLHYGPQFCGRFTPKSVYAPLYSALVCGINVPNGRAWELFVDTGLIHILVVSGAHLIFVERLCMRCPKRERLLLLAGYCWLTGFGAPVLRALMRRLCGVGLVHWGWTNLQIEAAATAVILLVYPPWLMSRSFLMSWLCALAMQAPLPLPMVTARWRAFSTSVKCYLFLFPFCPSSPLAIAWNGLVGPLIGEILFPVCVLAFVCPPMVFFSDGVWRALLWILEMGPKAPPSQVFWPSVWLWWLPLSIHGLLLYGEWKWRRAVAFLYSP